MEESNSYENILLQTDTEEFEFSLKTEPSEEEQH